MTIGETTAMTTGSAAVVRSLIAHGVDRVYCLPGIQNDAFFNALFDADGAIRAIHTRHEQGAAYMALGAALATGEPAVYSVVPGPGFLNTAAALVTAYSTGARVFCLTGQIPSDAIGKGHGYLHETPDQLGILRRLTKWAERVRRPDDAPPLIAEAFRQLRSGRPRPVGLEIPPDTLTQQAEIAPVSPLPAESDTAIDDDALSRAAALLRTAERPMLFVGGGATDAAAEIKAIAERLGAPVVAYRMGRGILDDRHPLSHTLPGGHALWEDCDVVLAIGTRLQMPLSAWGTDPALKIIKIDVDPEEISRITEPTIGLVGRAAVILRRLAEELSSSPADIHERVARSQAIQQRVAAQLSALEPQVAFLRAIRDVLPDDGVIVEDMTQVGYAARIAYETRRPRTFLSSGYQGTLGAGFAMALGAKDALGTAPVVAISGDGGFMFNVQELSTAVHHDIPVVTVLFNDGAYGNVRRMQEELYGNRVIATDLTNPDFVRLGESFGVASYRVRDPHGLRDALERALSRSKPALIEVPCGPMPDPWGSIVMGRIRGT